MRVTELLLELGNAPADYHVTDNNPEYRTVVCEELGLEFTISRQFEKAYVYSVFIEFSVHGKYNLTGSGNEIKILSTVRDMFETSLHYFLKPTDQIIEFASEKGEESRVSLYTRFVPIISKILGPGWKYSGDQYNPDGGLRIFKWERVRNSLAESGNSPAPFEISEKSHNAWRITAPDINLDLDLYRTGEDPLKEDQVYISFMVNSNTAITGEGNAVKVFSTVKAMLKQYLNMFIVLDDKRVYFTATRDEGSRLRLYERVVPVISKILGRNWKYVDDDDAHSAVKFYNWVRASQLREKKVQSTWITDLTYNRPNKILTMRLSNGVSYSIPGITRTTFEQWTKTPLKGTFFHDRIKDKFNVKRI
jgi:KTSC domain